MVQRPSYLFLEPVEFGLFIFSTRFHNKKHKKGRESFQNKQIRVFFGLVLRLGQGFLKNFSLEVSLLFIFIIQVDPSWRALKIEDQGLGSKLENFTIEVFYYKVSKGLFAWIDLLRMLGC